MDAHQIQIDRLTTQLKERFAALPVKADIFKEPDFTTLYDMIKRAEPAERPEIGKRVNKVRAMFQRMIAEAEQHQAPSERIDPTAPFDKNVRPENRPNFLPITDGSLHPLMSEMNFALDIFRHMGFEVAEARELDDEYHMFDSLNFPVGHPARDGWDTFVTEEGLMPIAHATAMQNRCMKDKTPPIAVVFPGRVFRNESLDATHEHTFYQIDGMCIGEGLTLADMMGTLQTFFENFFGQSLRIKTQPAHFPFTEPSLEFMIEKPKSIGGSSDWLEVLGCGMIHPNVLREGGIDPTKYTGFAWGGGFDRLVMLKYGIEDVRHFHSGKLAFLRKFQ